MPKPRPIISAIAPSTCIDMRELDQVLAHVHDGEIEIGEGPELPTRESRFYDKGALAGPTLVGLWRFRPCARVSWGHRHLLLFRLCAQVSSGPQHLLLIGFPILRKQFHLSR